MAGVNPQIQAYGPLSPPQNFGAPKLKFGIHQMGLNVGAITYKLQFLHLATLVLTNPHGG